MGDKKPDTLCKRTESPHRCADGRYGLAQHNEQRTDGCRQESDLDDRFPGTLIHAVELVHELLHGRYDLADGGHQDIAKRNSQLLQLRFQDGELTI